LLRAYTTLQVSPQAPEEEIREAYDRLQQTWRLDRYPNDRWKAEAAGKLRQIQEAYDRIRLSRQTGSATPKSPAGFAPIPPPPPPLPTAQTAPSPTPPFQSRFKTQPGESRDREQPLHPHRPRFGARQRWIAGALLIAAAVCALLLWPGMYRYESLNAGNRIYPLRIHVLTGRATYFDGSAWVSPPIQPPPGHPAASSSSPVEKTPAVDTGGMPPTVPGGGPLPAGTAASPPAAEKALPAARHPATAAAPSPIEAWPPAPARSIPKAGPVARAQASPRAVPGKPPGPGGFSIQIRAFREEEDAQDFLQQAKSRYPDARIEEAALEGNATWYRIVVGSFTRRQEALDRLRTDPAMAAYPGSFVQQTRSGR
jgi:cell division septation protein DedD